MERIYKIKEEFSNVGTTEEHNGYSYSVGEALTIVILGSFCGLRNTSQIHQWASASHIKGFLSEHFGISKVPCYYWLLCLLRIVKPESFNECFISWVKSLIPCTLKGLTLSLDGKTIRSTGKMQNYINPLHIVSAHIAELGITFGQQTVYDKSNEIPAVRDLLEMLDIEGCMVVADAINCQKDTAKVITSGKADYLLSVKDNHQTLKQDIEGYVQDIELQEAMCKAEALEKSRDRIELRRAYVTYDIDWISGKDEWAGLACIGAINTQFTTKKGTTSEWHYYISSRKLTADELLKHARLEWTVEAMHWLLDVHFCEDYCRIEDKNVQQNLNIVRKIVLNSIKRHKDKTKDKRPVSKIMLGCLLEPQNLLDILDSIEN